MHDGQEPCDCCGYLTDSFLIRKWGVCDLCRFLIESNKIEGIFTKPSKDQIFKAKAFLRLKQIEVADLCQMANSFEPGVLLRTQPGMDVHVKEFIAPKGGPEMILDLQHLLESSAPPYESHRWFEALHPFTDGNGRTGRLYWLWKMQAEGSQTHLGFLHTWYYQSLKEEVLI